MARRAFSRSPHVGAISRAAATHLDCGLACAGTPIGSHAITQRVMAASSSGASDGAAPGLDALVSG